MFIMCYCVKIYTTQNDEKINKIHKKIKMCTLSFCFSQGHFFKKKKCRLSTTRQQIERTNC